MDTLIAYEASTVTPEQVNAEIEGIMARASTDPQLKAELQEIGLDPTKLQTDFTTDALHADPGAKGSDPVTAGILIVYGVRIGYRIANDLWSRIILPRLEVRFGVGALKGGTPATPPRV